MTTDKIADKPKQERLCKSKNGVLVTYDPVHSHVATHFKDTPELKRLVTEVVIGMALNGNEVATHIDMGKVIGTCDVVDVDADDEIVYGMRRNRNDDGLVPFTKTRQAQPCRSVALHLIPQADKTYRLVSAWIGTYGDDEPFPASPYANDKSLEYWQRHAFVYGNQEIVPGTETSNFPW